MRLLLLQKKKHTHPLLWTTDTDGKTPTLLAQCAYSCEIDHLRLRWPSGKEMPVSLLGHLAIEGLDVGQKVELVAAKTAGPDLITCEGEKKPDPRAWLMSGFPAPGIWELSLQTHKTLPRPLGPGPRETTREFFGASYFRGRPLPSANPVDDVAASAAAGDSLWMIQRSCQYTRRTRQSYLMIYTPAPRQQTAWSRNDRWLGPMKSPDGGPIFAICAGGAGRVWLTCSEGVFLANAAEVAKQAMAAGFGCTTEQWREAFPKRVAASPWRQQVMLALGQGKCRNALSIIDKKLNELGAIGADSAAEAREAWGDAMLYKALALSASGRLEEGLGLYTQVAADARLEPAAREHAAIQRIYVLHMLARWQDLLQAIEATGCDMRKEAHEEFGWGFYIRQARQELKKAAGTVPAAHSVKP